MTSEPNRPLASVSLPRWMKSKITDRYDLEQSAFSPPNHDDGFFLIRYKSKSPEREVPEPNVTTVNGFSIGEALKNSTGASEKALSLHTEPCQQFIPQAKFNAREIGLRRATESVDKFKSTGTDDGFKGDAAACGYSVLQVAQSMVSGESKLFTPSSQRVRRNSKSLPASPLTSPKLVRKNPFFTETLFGSSEGVNGLSGRLAGFVGSSSRIDEGHLSAGSDESPSGPPSPRPTILRAKPSELREMNFWSPTSM